ncbi:MAG: hypothetical protein GX429_03930, partial [Bacteroidales bacterium]|nr:hypothetical protein [Bacteroidales bacterium]
MKYRYLFLIAVFFGFLSANAQNAPDFVSTYANENSFGLIRGNEPNFTILSDAADFEAMQFALKNLQNDFLAVTGKKPTQTYDAKTQEIKIIVGTLDKSKYIDQLI